MKYLLLKLIITSIHFVKRVKRKRYEIELSLVPASAVVIGFLIFVGVVRVLGLINDLRH